MSASPPRTGAGTTSSRRSCGAGRSTSSSSPTTSPTASRRRGCCRWRRTAASPVIANRPFRRKALIHRFEGTPLPGWAAEIGAGSWAQVLLRFILSHPAITVAIPATTRVDHVRENLAAASGPLPDEAMRRRMVATVREL